MSPGDFREFCALVRASWDSTVGIGYISFSREPAPVAHAVSVPYPDRDGGFINIDIGENGRIVRLEVGTVPDAFPELSQAHPDLDS